MATKYFHDSSESAIELTRIDQVPNAEFKQRFPDTKGFRLDGYYMLVGYAKGEALDSQALPVTRKIDFKQFPSRHECNSKCLNGKVNGTCECRCGGKNHGRGLFTSRIKD
jgi:hypothetical protein